MSQLNPDLQHRRTENLQILNSCAGKTRLLAPSLFTPLLCLNLTQFRHFAPSLMVEWAVRGMTPLPMNSGKESRQILFHGACKQHGCVSNQAQQCNTNTQVHMHNVLITPYLFHDEQRQIGILGQGRRCNFC